MKKRSARIEGLEQRLLFSSPTQLSFVTEPTGTSVGATLPTFTVAVTDANNNIITGNSDNITLSLSNGPGTLNGSVTVKAVNGIATFSNLSINDAGTYALQARDGSLNGLSTAFGVNDELTAADVNQILRDARNVSLPTQTIVVVDRQGNILGIYGQDPGNTLDSITDLPSNFLTPGVAPSYTSAAQGQLIAAMAESTPAGFALINAVAEARTVAYFESSQNAFTTRTARFIVTPNFPQGVDNTEAGPLLGVEFSQALGDDALPPSYETGLAAGLSGNPGGIPLFLNGQPVGGIGVAGSGNIIAPLQDLAPEVPGTPAFESDPTGFYYNGIEENSFDEAVAQAGAAGFSAPSGIISTSIFVNGLALPFTGEGAASGAPSAGTIAADGLLTAEENAGSVAPRVRFAYSALGKTSSIITGGGPAANTYTPYPTTVLQMGNGAPIAVTLNNNNPTSGGYGVNAGDTYVANGGKVPLLNASGSITYSPGNFGYVPAPGGSGPHLTTSDVNTVIEEAITQAEATRAAIRLPSDVPMQIYVAVTDTEGDILGVAATTDATNFSFDIAVQKARTAAYFSTSENSANPFAFSSRAIGFVADSTLPPAIENGVEGPLNGLQDVLALPQNQAAFTPFITESIGGVPTVVKNPIGNGITIFPGGAPLYKDGVLVGAVGISGDGVDQDDLVAFAGTAGYRPPTTIEDDSLGSGQVVTALTQKINELGYTPPTGDPAFTFLTIAQDVNVLNLGVGFDDPDVPNLDNLSTAQLNVNTNDIITRILARLSAVGVDSVNLPYQKFPRNPGV